MLVRFSKQVWIVGMILSAMWGYLVYHQIYALHGYPSDMKLHIGYARDWFEHNLIIPHFLWHSTVGMLHKIGNISYEYAAWLVSFGLYSGLLTTVAFIVHHRLKKMKPFIVAGTFFSIMVIAPFYISSLSHFIYLGVGSPSVWHNITLMNVKFMGLITMIVTLKAFKKEQNKTYVLAMILLLLSMLAKPSFMMIFLPAFTVWVFIRNCQTQKKIIWLVMFWICSIILLIWQSTIVNDGSNKIIIDFLGVWSIYTHNILWAIVSALMFPLLYIALEFKKLYDDDYLLLSWGMVFCGLIIAMLFAEEGERYLHGNFMWGYSLGMFFVYLFSIVSFISQSSQMRKWKLIILSSVLLYQVGVGIYYFAKVLHGESVV